MSALIVLTDEVGQPRESTYEVSDWRRFDAAKLLELVRAAWPGETVLGVEWAAEPRLYSVAGDAVLLVRCGGVDQPRATWAPLTDAPVATSGRVLTVRAVEALVKRVGGPT